MVYYDLTLPESGTLKVCPRYVIWVAIKNVMGSVEKKAESWWITYDVPTSHSAGLSKLGGWGAWPRAPPSFGRLVNPISTRRKDYAHQITIFSTPRFSDPPTALNVQDPSAIDSESIKPLSVLHSELKCEW